ncbi:hypothetical protein VSR68_04815 [Paraburkholderia phymatum]
MEATSDAALNSTSDVESLVTLRLVELMPATVLLIVLRPVDNETMPVDVDVERLPSALLVALRPVESESIPVDSDAMPVEVDVERLVTVLLVVLRPVESELMPVDVDVDREVSWL